MSSEDTGSASAILALQEANRNHYANHYARLSDESMRVFGRSEVANLINEDDFTDADFEEFVDEHPEKFWGEGEVEVLKKHHDDEIEYIKKYIEANRNSLSWDRIENLEAKLRFFEAYKHEHLEKHFDFGTYYRRHRKDDEDMPFRINEFSVGQRVKLDENYRGSSDIDSWVRQSDGGMGVIADRPCAGGDTWVSVDWDNGRKNSYHKAALILVDDAGNNYIAGDNIGWHVVERQSTDPVKIQQSAQRRRDEIEELYKLPLLPGMRVCLNPETENYQRLARDIGNSVGYITNPLMSEEHLLQWNSRSQKDAYGVRVRFDNDKEYVMYLKQLLPVEAPSITIINTVLDNGNTYFLPEKENAEVIEDQIIMRRAHIMDRKVYDEKWRTEIYEKISSQS